MTDQVWCVNLFIRLRSFLDDDSKKEIKGEIEKKN
jgi:hypothetical protein